MKQTAPVLEINDLYAAYGERAEVLHGINLSVNAGEVVAILGANGAGKTTLIKAINGLLRPVKGNINFTESAVNKLSAHEIAGLGISTVPEGRRIFPSLSVRENLLVGAYANGKGIGGNLARVLDLFPVLKNRIAQLAGTLSGGEQQMLAVGRSLMSSPKLLLLDEPSMGLAPMAVDFIFDVLSKIADTGVPLLIVEQNAAHALKLAGRGYVFEIGRIVLAGTSSELANNEAVVRAYLGG